MPRPYGIPFWKRSPFTRLLLPLMAGIILQWYVQISVVIIVIALVSFSISFILFLLLPLSLRFKLRAVQGFLIHLLLLCFGLLITWQKDIRHDARWYGKHYRPNDMLLVRIDEPLVEKNRSYKAEGWVEAIYRRDAVVPCKGRLLIYFSKDSSILGLHYGQRILINKQPQWIRNSGNPGAFDYVSYAAFHQTFQNVFLKENDWQLLLKEKMPVNRLKQWIFAAREYVLAVLRRTIDAGRDQSGIAGALLIGYTNDLDRDIVQAYSNTGVVHIIAVSGMHLGLIYVLLHWLLGRIPGMRRFKFIETLLILVCLWLFSLLTGAAASVLRSAVMFSFIIAGSWFSKKASVYNSLAASAFLLLCYDPYFLWDVGFQLSYLALAGICIFQKPIYDLRYIKNKWIDKIWTLMAVSIAAQILTFPVCIYYFHQFPNLFLISNLVAVPLSGIILYAEIALVAFSGIPLMAALLGKWAGALLWVMNKFILRVNELPFAVYDGIRATVLSAWLLYGAVIFFSAWLIKRDKIFFIPSISFLLALTALSAYHKLQAAKQQKIVVYNIPGRQAIDMVSGNHYQFIGDSALLGESMLQNFHIKPARISFQIFRREGRVAGIFHHDIFYQFRNKRIIIIDKPLVWDASERITADLLIISHNPRISMVQLDKLFHCRKIIFDASNNYRKIEKWQQECKTLGLSCYSVPANGAFIYNIGI